jgi:hypothetical protein
MLVYPQLATGASAQYPAGRRRVCRTVSNEGSGGTSIRYADAGAGKVEWELIYSGLTDEEAGALEEFFRSTEGRLTSFVFPDPLGNLLAWSERFDEAAWTRDPLLTVTGGQADPFGGTGAFRVTNGGGVAQSLRQTLEVPAEGAYCLSVYARAGAPSVVDLAIGEQRKHRGVGAEWSRIAGVGQPAGTGETVTFGLEVAGGATVDIYGAQVEGQIGASGYKRTGSRGGVYGNARFRDDVLRITTEGVNRHSCRIHITHANHL